MRPVKFCVAHLEGKPARDRRGREGQFCGQCQWSRPRYLVGGDRTACALGRELHATFYSEVPTRLPSEKGCYHETVLLRLFAGLGQERGGQACAQAGGRKEGPCTLMWAGTLATAMPKK